MEKKLEKKYRLTIIASYLAFFSQGIINNVNPILFIYYREYLGLSVDNIAFLIAVNFGVQILVDLLASRYADRIGPRHCMLLANAASIIGLLLIGLSSIIFTKPYIGLIVAAIFGAVGSSLLEVQVSPIIEAVPLDGKDKRMSIVHSFYSWGCFLFIAFSTLLLKLIGSNMWFIIPIIWTIIPIIDGIMFVKAPIEVMVEEKRRVPVRKLIKSKFFWSFCIMMICAGSSEMAMAQWASYFAEAGLHVSKTVGDLLGAGMFAFLMGISRVFYGKTGAKIKIEFVMILSLVLCMLSYILTAVAPHPLIALSGCALSGLACGVLWPGTYSMAAKNFRTGGTTFFALLAFSGDIGCLSGPSLVNIFSKIIPSEGLKAGLGFATVFPLIMMIIVIFQKKAKSRLQV